MDKKQFIWILIAGSIRLLLYLSKSSLIHNRIEVSTPLNGFKRVREGVYLYKHGIDPYSGDIIHEMPLILLAHAQILQNIPNILPYIYIIADIFTAILLYKMAKLFFLTKFSEQTKEKSSFAAGTEELQIQKEDLETIPNYVLLAYLFNPFSLLSCASITTSVFSNILLALYFYFLAKKSLVPCLLFLAVESCRSFYPFVLIAPVILTFRKNVAEIAKACIIFVVMCILICWINFKLMGSWTFLSGTLEFIFYFGDLQPNIGLFWYFFTEMFEHFRPMFLITFQMNATVLYLIPLTIKLRKDPILLASILTTLMTIFKSYPCFGDVGFYLAILPIWKRCLKFMAHNFVVFCFFLITVLIMPAFWHLWIYAGSANANFYFGATLGFSTGQIFLVTDLLFAYVKREFCLKNGQKFLINGVEAKIILE